MIVRVLRAATLLTVLVLVTEVSVYNANKEYEFGSYIHDNVPETIPYVADEEYIRHIHSMINAYRGDTKGGRLVIETNALIDTKYRTWKRNADLINSLLALPKGMNDAGR